MTWHLLRRFLLFSLLASSRIFSCLHIIMYGTIPTYFWGGFSLHCLPYRVYLEPIPKNVDEVLFMYIHTGETCSSDALRCKQSSWRQLLSLSCRECPSYAVHRSRMPLLLYIELFLKQNSVLVKKKRALDSLVRNALSTICHENVWPARGMLRWMTQLA